MMMLPWDKPKLTYPQFMDSYLRVSVSVDGHPRKMFSVLDEGASMNAEMVMLDGKLVTIKVEGHPRTTDPMITTTELVNYIMNNFNYR
jgi:hypothetical protein